MTTWNISSRCVKAEIQSLGAMLGPAFFSLGDRTVQPFAVAPWAEESGVEYDELPPMLRRLRGEWPCVPFGMPEPRAGLPTEWMPAQAFETKPIDSQPHGFSSNAEWKLSRLEPHWIELSVEYPAHHCIRKIVRTIRASEDAPILEITLSIEAREHCELPIGVHPVLRLPGKPMAAQLQFGPEARVWTLPTTLEPGVSTLGLNARDRSLVQVPVLSGGTEDMVVDITKLPLECDTEELVLVVGHNGTARLMNHEERYSVAVSWDSELFPACLLWLSNRGRGYYPWNHRFLGVGVEPVRSAFDLGTRVSSDHNNPLWKAGVPCTYSFAPDRRLETTYTIEISETV